MKGEWKDGKQNGKGIFTTLEGETYNGGWKDGSWGYGQGTYTFPNGNKYVGSWKNGVPWNGTGFKINGDIKYILVNGKME